MALDQMPDALTTLRNCTVAHNTARNGLGGGIWASDANLELDASHLEANQALTGSGGGVASVAQEDSTTTTTTFAAPFTSCTEVEVQLDWLQNSDSCVTFVLASFGYVGTCDAGILSTCAEVYAATYPFIPHNCSGCTCNTLFAAPDQVIVIVDHCYIVFTMRILYK